LFQLRRVYVITLVRFLLPISRSLLTITQLANLNVRKSGKNLSPTVMSSESGPTTASGEQRPLTLTSWNIDDTCGIRVLLRTNNSFHLNIQILNNRCPPHRSPLCSSWMTSLTILKSILSLYLQASVEDPWQPRSPGTFEHVRSSSILCTLCTQC
jgi:hypothetical protein